MAYTLKNPGIATANPGVAANQNYVNALYKEAYGRDATAKELGIYTGKTVKDAANLILGQDKSPFAAAPAPAPAPAPKPAPAPAPAPSPAPAPIAPSVKPPAGAVPISGTQYPTREAQQAAFTNIQPMGNTLYGVPKTAAPAQQPATQPAAGASYLVKTGDTLSAIAAQNGTTVSEIMRLNPSITNPNLIYAGKSITLPGSPAVAPAPTTAGGAPDFSTIKNTADANATINAAQGGDITGKTGEETPPIKKSFEDLNKLLQDALSVAPKTGAQTVEDLTKTYQAVQKTVAPTTAAPTLPNLEQKFKDYQVSYGINGLETQLNDLRAQEQELLTAKQSRINAERGKTVATNVIEGRVSETERQENERIAAVQAQMGNITNQLNTKYNVVNSLMKLAGTDYDNAVGQYDKQMATNINLFNTVKGIEESAKSAVDRNVDNARSSLQIIYNQVASGALNASALPTDTRTLIAKLEVQAGMPAGFFEALQSKNPKAEIVTTNNWTAADGKTYTSVITKDPTTGEIKTTNVLLGMSKPAGTTPDTIEYNLAKEQGFKGTLLEWQTKQANLKAKSTGGAGTKPTEAEVKVFYKQNMAAELKKAVGVDGHVNPTDWAKARKSWTNNTPYSGDDFDSNFRDYIDPSHPQDYSGFEEYRAGFRKPTPTEALGEAQ